MANASVVVVGSANLDHVVRVRDLPAVGATVAGDEYQTGPGGKGLNQAVAAARESAAVSMVAALGTDAPGAVLERVMAAEGVNTAAVRRVEGVPTGVALITVADSGANTIVVAPGANAELRPADLPAAVLAQAAVVLSQLEISLDTVVAALHSGRAAGALTVLNPAPAPGALPTDVLRLVDVLVPNEIEAAALSGCPDPRDAAAALADTGPDTVIVTVGESGCLIAGRGGSVREVSAFAVDAVDTTAAGDAYCGVLAAGLAAGRALDVAVRRASAAGALAATRPGAVASLPHRAEIDRLVAGP